MKSKKIVCVALTGLLALSTAMLAACGDEPTPPPSGDPVYAKDWLQPLFELGNTSGARTKDGLAMNSTHDPVVVEAKRNGVSEYYAFSTDNDQYGVQIRKSANLYNWERVGVAINGYTTSMKEADVRSMYLNTTSELDEVYKKIRTYSDWKSDCWTLWAPDVVPATSNTTLDANGEWWLYSCWTAGFGSEQSIIFKLTSQNGITGPYTYDGIIVEDSLSDYNINEIDPSVYYSADGSKMFMSYGSYKGGFATLELDPQTGMRLSGETDEPGKRTLANVDAEGSAVAYHTVNIYTGDIASDEYDEDAWDTKGQYYMMGSWGALAYNYNMRVWTSDTPDGTFTSERGTSGLQVSASWTWRKEGEGVADGTTSAYENTSKDTNFYIPGHNDMLTTTDGVNVIAYHTRVAESTKDGNPSFAEGEHYLYTSMYDFNSKGQLVINPNRYAGEKIGKVTAEDLLSKTDGLYSAIIMQSRNNTRYEEKATIYHPNDCTLNADGTLTLNGATGKWKVYGDHYIWLEIDGANYYGTVMPAQIRQYDADQAFIANNGLTISAISTDGTTGTGGENKILYMNMQFDI